LPGTCFKLIPVYQPPLFDSPYSEFPCFSLPPRQPGFHEIFPPRDAIFFSPLIDCFGPQHPLLDTPFRLSSVLLSLCHVLSPSALPLHHFAPPISLPPSSLQGGFPCFLTFLLAFFLPLQFVSPVRYKPGTFHLTISLLFHAPFLSSLFCRFLRVCFFCFCFHTVF